tara:strand:- start:52 stop:381 length:330 start_codon:yes stop_codon:yes gene_type:complete
MAKIRFSSGLDDAVSAVGHLYRLLRRALGQTVPHFQCADAPVRISVGRAFPAEDHGTNHAADPTADGYPILTLSCEDRSFGPADRKARRHRARGGFGGWRGYSAASSAS